MPSSSLILGSSATLVSLFALAAANTPAPTTVSGWNLWTTTTKTTTSYDPAWTDWEEDCDEEDPATTWSGWTTTTTKSYDPDWNGWSTSTKKTTTKSYDPAWPEWTTTTTKSYDDPAWTEWADVPCSTSVATYKTTPCWTVEGKSTCTTVSKTSTVTNCAKTPAAVTTTAKSTVTADWSDWNNWDDAKKVAPTTCGGKTAVTTSFCSVSGMAKPVCTTVAFDISIACGTSSSCTTGTAKTTSTCVDPASATWSDWAPAATSCTTYHIETVGYPVTTSCTTYANAVPTGGAPACFSYTLPGTPVCAIVTTTSTVYSTKKVEASTTSTATWGTWGTWSSSSAKSVKPTSTNTDGWVSWSTTSSKPVSPATGSSGTWSGWVPDATSAGLPGGIATYKGTASRMNTAHVGGIAMAAIVFVGAGAFML